MFNSVHRFWREADSRCLEAQVLRRRLLLQLVFYDFTYEYVMGSLRCCTTFQELRVVIFVSSILPCCVARHFKCSELLIFVSSNFPVVSVDGLISRIRTYCCPSAVSASIRPHAIICCRPRSIYYLTQFTGIAKRFVSQPAC